MKPNSEVTREHVVLDARGRSVSGLRSGVTIDGIELPCHIKRDITVDRHPSTDMLEVTVTLQVGSIEVIERNGGKWSMTPDELLRITREHKMGGEPRHPLRLYTRIDDRVTLGEVGA